TRQSVAQILVPSPTGNGNALIPLARVADVHMGEGRPAIHREANQRYLPIKCSVRGRDLGGFVAQAQQAVSRAVQLPEGYYLTWGGEFENQRRAMRRLSSITPASLCLIFLTLLRAFGSWRNAALILLNVPFAAVGGVLALWLTGTVLSVSACIGFIALFGVA